MIPLFCCKRLDEPTPDQVRGDERRAAPDPARLRGDDKLGPGNAHKKTDLGYCPYIPEYMKWGVCFFVQRKVYFGRGKKIYIDDGGPYGNDNGPA